MNVRIRREFLRDLKMGSKSLFIVLEDAVSDDEMIEHAAMTAFLYGEQNCSAKMHQVVAAPLVEEFTDRIQFWPILLKISSTRKLFRKFGTSF